MFRSNLAGTAFERTQYLNAPGHFNDNINFSPSPDYYTNAINQLLSTHQQTKPAKESLLHLYTLYTSRANCYFELSDFNNYVADLLLALNVLFFKYPLEEWTNELESNASLLIDIIQKTGEISQKQKYIELAKYNRAELQKRKGEYLIFRLQKLAPLSVEQYNEELLEFHNRLVQNLKVLSGADVSFKSASYRFEQHFSLISARYWRIVIDQHYANISRLRTLTQTDSSLRLLYGFYFSLSHIYHKKINNIDSALKVSLLALDALNQITGFIKDDINAYCSVLANLSQFNVDSIFTKICIFAMNVLQGGSEAVQEIFTELQKSFEQLQDFDEIRRAAKIFKYLKEHNADLKVWEGEFLGSTNKNGVDLNACLEIAIAKLDKQMLNLLLEERMARSNVEETTYEELSSSSSSYDLSSSVGSNQSDASSVSFLTSSSLFTASNGFDAVKSKSNPVLGNVIEQPNKVVGRHSGHSEHTFKVFKPQSQVKDEGDLDLNKKKDKKSGFHFNPFKKKN